MKRVDRKYCPLERTSERERTSELWELTKDAANDVSQWLHTSLKNKWLTSTSGTNH